MKKISLKIFNKAESFKVPSLKMKRVFGVFLERYGRLLKTCEVSIIFVKKNEMKSLNERWKGGSGATDVLSFDYGEIYICPDVADKYRKDYGTTIVEEILFLFVHGLLHIAGFTHENEKKFAIMMKKTEEILK